MVLLCRQCAETAFGEWKGWPERNPVPRIPKMEDGICPTCRSTLAVNPEHIVFHNIHGWHSTGLPDYFILRIFEPGSSEYEFLKKWGLPYIDRRRFQMTQAGFQNFLSDDMRVLFVGLNPPPKALEDGHYFTSFPSEDKRSFWYQLYHSCFSPEIYHELEADVKIFGNPDNHLGFIDLVNDHVDVNPNNLDNDDLVRGRSRLNGEICRYKPKIVCFLGKGTYRKFKGMPNYELVEYGIQDWKVCDSQIFVAAFPSAMIITEAKICILRDLYALYR